MSLTAIGVGMAALAVIGGGLGIGFATSSAVKAIAQQPEAHGKIRSTLLIGAALADAKKQASLEYEQIIADANKKSDEMIEQARIKTIEVANEEKARAKSEIADLINKAADKITNTKSDEKLYDDFLKEMK